MNKEELTTSLATKTGLSKKESQKILDALVETVIEAVAAGEKITLVGFGSFEARQRKERQGLNPKTREAMTIPATQVPVFAAGKLFKEKVAPPTKEATKTQPKAQSKPKSQSKPKAQSKSKAK